MSLFWWASSLPRSYGEKSLPHGTRSRRCSRSRCRPRDLGFACVAGSVPRVDRAGWRDCHSMGMGLWKVDCANEREGDMNFPRSFTAEEWQVALTRYSARR